MISCCSIWFSFDLTKKIYHVTGELCLESLLYSANLVSFLKQ